MPSSAQDYSVKFEYPVLPPSAQTWVVEQAKNKSMFITQKFSSDEKGIAEMDRFLNKLDSLPGFGTKIESSVVVNESLVVTVKQWWLAPTKPLTPGTIPETVVIDQEYREPAIDITEATTDAH